MGRLQRLGGLCVRVVRLEPVTTLPRSAADVLAGHVLFEIEASDRMYLTSTSPSFAARRGDRRTLRRAPGQPARLLGILAPMTAASTRTLITSSPPGAWTWCASPRCSARTTSPMSTGGRNAMTEGWYLRRCCMSGRRRNSASKRRKPGRRRHPRSGRYRPRQSGTSGPSVEGHPERFRHHLRRPSERGTQETTAEEVTLINVTDPLWPCGRGPPQAGITHRRSGSRGLDLRISSRQHQESEISSRRAYCM